MVSSDNINERMDRIEEAQELDYVKGYHGVAARLDRLPVGGWHRKMVFLFSCCIFCDGLDTFVGGGIIAGLLESGWSTVELNGAFSSLTMVGYLIGCLMSGWLGDHLGRRRGLLINLTIFAIATFARWFCSKYGDTLRSPFSHGHWFRRSDSWFLWYSRGIYSTV